MPEKTLTPLDKCFAALEEIAAAGTRCPSGNQLSRMRTTYIEALAIEGRIRCTIHTGGWRVVEILIGPQAGKSTQAPPPSARAIRVYDGGGLKRAEPAPRYRPTQRRMPSLPIFSFRTVEA